MSNKVSIGIPSVEGEFWIQDIKIDTFSHMIKLLVPAKGGGMQWIKMSEQFAREIGFINPEAILKIVGK